MRYSLIASLTALVASSLVAARVAPPLVADDLFKSKADPYSTFIDHFSPNTPNSEVYFQSQIKNLFPNSTITVTSDHRFRPLAYAGQQEDPILIQELEMESLKKLYYFPPTSRRYGQGVVFNEVSLGGWTVGWRDIEMKVVFASWSEGFSRPSLWFLISEDKAKAQEFFRVVTSHLSQTRDAILVFDQGYWQADYGLWQSVQGAEWKDVILEEEFKERLQRDYRSFYKSEKIYKDLQVPWKRGLIFLGPPGNGKTISLKAIMHESNVPVLYVKSFHNWAGDEAGIKAIFERARAEAPCLLVLEDLDSLITDMNRSFFLNEVDGIDGNDGLLLIGTTNHFDRLDPALSSRPSRFDRKYMFANPAKGERRQYAVYWQKKLKSNEDIEFPDELLDQFAEKTDKFSFAYMKEVFISSLLTLAGLEDPSKAPSFQSVVLDQIKHLRKQLEEDEQAILMAEFQGFRSEGSARDDGYQGSEMDHQEMYEGQRMPSRVVGSDGLPQMVVQGEGREPSPLIIQV